MSILFGRILIMMYLYYGLMIIMLIGGKLPNGWLRVCDKAANAHVSGVWRLRRHFIEIDEMIRLSDLLVDEAGDN